MNCPFKFSAEFKELAACALDLSAGSSDWKVSGKISGVLVCVWKPHSILVCEKMSKSTALLLCVYKGEKTLTTEGADLARSRLNGQGSDAQEKHFSSTLIAVFP